LRARESTATATGPPPFLETAPPHWLVRGLALLLIGLFVVALVLAAVIRLPETVASPFVLVPERGTDPVRASRGGVVTKVAFRGAEPVAQGDTLFLIQSAPFGDRSTELGALEEELSGARVKIENARREFESQRRADEAEQSRLSARVAELEQITSFRRRQHALTKELLAQYEELLANGFSSRAESIVRELEANRVAADLAQAQLELAEAKASTEKLRHEMAMRAIRQEELERSARESSAKAEIRAATLRAEVGTKGPSALEVAAPCSGVVLRSRVKAAGAVVAEGDLLGEIACSGETLEAELEVPPSGAGRLEAGQAVKLLYDAFPYQRYGVRFGKLRWVSPGAIRESDRTVFRALVDLDEDAIPVDGRPRPLLAGMGGSARVVIGRRSLLAYAFEPIRRLRESLATGPAASSSGAGAAVEAARAPGDGRAPEAR
jgi:membrane fusion protein